MGYDDLVPLFAPQPDGPRVRQGVVVAWDVNAGTGTINVAGGTLTDVPFLTPGGIAWFTPGDPVVLLAQGGAWFVLGRVVKGLAGSVRGIGRNTQGVIFGNSGMLTPGALGLTFLTYATVNIAVPLWANSANITATFQVFHKNSTAAADYLRARILAPDGVSVSHLAQVGATAWGSLTATLLWGVVVTPGGTLTMLGQISTQVAGWASDAGASCILQVSALFNSNGG